jgi:hypothetical protein
MLLYLFLGFLLMVATVAMMVAFTRADPALLARSLRWSAIGFALIALVLLPIIGRGSLIALAPAVLLPLLKRVILARAGGWAGAAPRTGQSSSVETAWLAMRLDHDSGQMEGEVRAGRFAGRRLADLPLADLLALLDECRGADPESVTLLEAYLDRVHGASWRGPEGDDADAAQGGAQGRTRERGRGGSGGMTREEAYEILGLEPGASPEAVKEAHRRLMQNYHPDRGGSTYIAAKINQAKDLLLGN